MKRRLISMLLALGLVGGMFAGLFSLSAADSHDGYEDWASAIFFPSVHNGAMVGDTGPWYTNVTVQNIEEARVYIEFSSYVTGTVHQTALLNPYASTTFQASQVLPSGTESGPVVATAYWAPMSGDNAPCGEDDVPTSITITRGSGGADSFQAEGTVPGAGAVNLPDYDEGDDYNVSVVGGNTISITWLDDGDAPATGASYLVEYSYITFDCEREPFIGGYAKQAAEGPMSASSRTNSDHVSVDGYTALPFTDVAWGPSTEFSNFGLSILGLPVGALTGMNWDGHSYLPIIQNNSGWESVINISNIDGSDSSDNASVTVRTYVSGGPGLSGQADGNYSFNLGRGETQTVTLADLGVTDTDYIGSVWIESDYGMVVTIERYKSDSNMLIINESAPSVFDFSVEGEPGQAPFTIGAGEIEWYEAHAPLVFSGYHGWNSGFSIVNTAEIQNTVNLSIRNESGTTVFTDQMTINPKSQKFVYMPHFTDISEGGQPFVGSALFSSPLPFHASVDQVKYETGEAMSYIATQSGAIPDCNFISARLIEDPAFCDFDQLESRSLDVQQEQLPIFGYGEVSPLSKLAFPLIQRGANGSGDTSGIQFFNGSSVGNVHARVWFFTGSGAAAPPTSAYGLGIPVNLGIRENATVYTLSISGMDNNTTLSAIAAVSPVLDGPGISNRGVLYAVTNNVNYDVAGDGSTAFNAVNAYGQFRTWSGPWFEWSGPVDG